MKVILLVVFISLTSCWTKYERNYRDPCSQKVYGWSPVLEHIAPYKIITTTPKRVTNNAGKIYVYNNYILQVEKGEGIHVIDNSNPAAPAKKGFIQIKACTEVEMKNGYLYTNNFNDLVTLQYSFADNIVQEVSRIPRTLQNLDVNYQAATPPGKGYYRCRIPQDSIVKGWQMDSLVLCNTCFKNQ